MGDLTPTLTSTLTPTLSVQRIREKYCDETLIEILTMQKASGLQPLL